MCGRQSQHTRFHHGCKRLGQSITWMVIISASHRINIVKVYWLSLVHPTVGVLYIYILLLHLTLLLLVQNHHTQHPSVNLKSDQIDTKMNALKMKQSACKIKRQSSPSETNCKPKEHVDCSQAKTGMQIFLLTIYCLNASAQTINRNGLLFSAFTLQLAGENSPSPPYTHNCKSTNSTF